MHEYSVLYSVVALQSLPLLADNKNVQNIHMCVPESLKQSSVILKMQGIPSHMWNLKPWLGGILKIFPFRIPRPSTPGVSSLLQKGAEVQDRFQEMEFLFYNLMNYRYQSV